MAITEYYVDPAINANSGTGTIGDPWGDLQYALNTVTRDATNGDRFNIKAGTAEVLTAGLSLATYGTPTEAAPLVIQGYTSAAGDGGIGEINNGGANVAIINTSALIIFVDMKMGNTGSAAPLTMGQFGALIRCEIHTASGTGVVIGNYAQVVGCYFHDLTGQAALHLIGAGSVGGSLALGNYFSNAGGQYTVYLASIGNTVIGNVFERTDADTTVKAIYALQRANWIIGNTIFNDNASTDIAIHASGTGHYAIVNNIIQGYSGSGATAITHANGFLVTAANAYYNNTANESIADVHVNLKANLALGSSPFVNAAGGNFEIDGDSDASEAAWPSAWKGLATTANAADIGAVQSGAGSGGGVSIYTRSVRVIKG